MVNLNAQPDPSLQGGQKELQQSTGNKTSEAEQGIENVSKEKLVLVTEAHKKVEANAECPNQILRVRVNIARIKKAVAPLFQKMGKIIRLGSQRIAEMHVIRKMKDIYDFLEHCDFRFIRQSEEPLLQGRSDEHLTALLLQYSELERHMGEISPEEFIKKIIEMLIAIGNAAFKPHLYEIREAMVAEVLTKYLAVQPIQEGLLVPVPTFNQQEEPVQIEYAYRHHLSLGETNIPVYIFAPALNKNRGEYNPILMFRGTRFVFSNATDFRSIVENFNKVGPARGVYEEFTPELASFFAEWFKEEQQPLFKIFGYSQGAVLGQRTLVDFYPYLAKGKFRASYFLNAPAVEQDIYERWTKIKPEEKPTSFVFVVSKDVVSFRGTYFIGIVKEVLPPSTGFLASHFGSKLMESTWNLYAVSEKESESPTRKLVNQVMSSNLVEGLYKLAVAQWKKMRKHDLRHHQLRHL